VNVLSYVLAVLAAGANATANVLQRKANRQEPPELSMSPRLLAGLVRRPVWLAGFGAVVASFLLMAAALGMGRLAAVQPIVVLELPLTLWGAARVLGSDLGWREWVPAGAMTTGLAGLVAFLAPQGGNHGKAGGLSWIVASAATIGLVAAAVAGGLVGTEPGRGARRPALLGAATGMTFGLTAAYMKGMTAGFSHGVVGVLGSWQTYAMAVSGLGGMFLMQNSLHSGRLLVAQPGITLADPAVAIIWGAAVFHERTHGGIELALAVVSGAVMAGATVALAHSPLLEDEAAAEEGDQTPPSAGGEAPDDHEAYQSQPRARAS
jgi:hypothetical protein